MGRFTKDPELRHTGNQTPVVSFTLAVDRDFASKDTNERETDFIDCVAWRSTAEFINKYYRKGSMAVVSGRLQIRNWDDKDGNKRRTSEIVVDNIYFGDSKRRDSESTGGDDLDFSTAYQAPASANNEYTELADDGELPF